MPPTAEKPLPDLSWSLAERELGCRQGGEINIGWHCSDRICSLGKADKVALIWEGPSGEVRRYSYDDLRQASDAVGAFLRGLGLGRGDRVCLFMDRIPELYVAFLGILKIGAIAQPLFSAFGDESLFVRLADAGTAAVLTQRRHASKVRKVLARLPQLKHVVLVDHDGKAPLREREVPFSLERTPRAEGFAVAPTHTESPSVLHYTSGTTGMPKGVQHAHYSLVSQYLTAKWALDLRDDDVYWCTADPGWVTGTSYGVIGPWSLGVTQCVLDRGFSAQGWYEFIARHGVSVWYTAPTAIRSLMKAGEETARRFELGSLRHLASVGEPLNAEAVRWSQRAFGKPFHDTYWQTETGSIMVCNVPGMQVRPGSMGKPFPGVTAAVLDPTSHTPWDEPERIGLIAFKPDWPALMRTYWNNDEAFQAKFKNGWYLSGDRGRVDADGYIWFVGRDDDIINTAGHLVSPFEVESALLAHPAVAESAVVSKPDPLNLEVVKAYVTLRPGFEANEALELEIMNFIRKRLSPLAMPQEISYTAALPKTRSGKIMRRLLHAREWGEEIGDTSTLEDED